MRQAATPSVSEEWTGLSERAQTDVEAILADLEVEIEVANYRLAEASLTDRDEAAAIKAETLEYLNDKWPYKDDMFMVSGSWRYPSLYISPDEVVFRRDYTEAFNVVRSNGFMETPLNKGEVEVTRVGLSFLAGAAEINTSIIQGPLDFLIFAEPHEVTLQYTRPGTPRVANSSAGEVTQALAAADAVLRAQLNGERTTFFDKNAKLQGSFLRSVIESVVTVLPAPDVPERVIMTGSKISSVYYRDKVSGEIFDSELINPNASVHFRAEMLGATLVDVIKHGYNRDYSSPVDLAAFATGLCVMLDPIEVHNLDLSRHGNPELIVPLRGISDPKIEIA